MINLLNHSYISLLHGIQSQLLIILSRLAVLIAMDMEKYPQTLTQIYYKLSIHNIHGYRVQQVHR